MKITWPSIRGKTITGRIDAALWPVVDALGIDNAARFYLKFGGCYVQVNGDRLQERNPLVREFGEAAAISLMAAIRTLSSGRTNYRVPFVCEFLARYLRSQGLNITEICCRLRRTDTMVRAYLKSDDDRRSESQKGVERRRRQFALEDAQVAKQTTAKPVRMAVPK